MLRADDLGDEFLSHLSSDIDLQWLVGALIDTEQGDRRGDGFELVMAQDRTRRLKVKMYQERSHRLPHVHIDYGGEHLHTASYRIDGGKRMSGQLDTKFDRIVRRWIAHNREGLLKIWNDLRSGDDVSILIGELSRLI